MSLIYVLKYSGYQIGSSAMHCTSWFSPIVSCLMFCAWTISISYKYRLYFTDTLLVCTNPLGSVVVRQIEVLPISATPQKIQHYVMHDNSVEHGHF